MFKIKVLIILFYDSVCQIPKSTLFLDCEGTPSNQLSGNRYPKENGYYNQRPLPEGFTADDIIVEPYLRGVRVRPSQRILVSPLPGRVHHSNMSV